MGSANSASFSNDTTVNQRLNSFGREHGISPMADVAHGYRYSMSYSAPAANTPQSGGASGNPSQSAIRPGYENLGGRGQ